MANESGPETAWKIFGANVRRERVLRAITQNELAERSGLNARTVAKIEAGELRIRATTIERVQRAIGCPFSRLLKKDPGLLGKGCWKFQAVLEKSPPDM